MASGVADHASVPPWVVRAAFVLTTPVGGLGPIAYAFLWWLLPRADLPESAAQRMARRFPQSPVWLGVSLVAIGVLLFAGQSGWLSPSVIVALGLIAIGALLFLKEPDGGRHSTQMPLSTGNSPTEPLGRSVGAADQETDLPPASLPGTLPRVRRREPSFLGPLTLGLGLVVIAAATLLDLAGAFTFTVAQAAALLLLVLGFGMAVGGFVGRARWLLLPVLVIAPFALVLTVLHVDLDDGFGDRTVTIRTLDEPIERRLAGGELTIDLLHLRPGESGNVLAHVGVGMLTLNVPDDITVDLTGSVGLGSTETLHSRMRGGGHACCRYGQQRAGFAQPVSWSPGPRDGTTPGIVSIEATVSIGGIRINHVDRSSLR